MIRTSDSTNALVAALADFHKADISVPKTADNPFFKSKYADLWTIKAQTEEVLNELGLLIVQLPGNVDGSPTLVTRLCHVSGQFMEAETPLKLPKDDPQAQGSAITYMRRYAYCAVLGIVADPDDDGEGAMRRGGGTTAKRSRPSSPSEVTPLSQVMAETAAAHDSGVEAPTPAQLKYLNDLIKRNGMSASDVEGAINQHAPPWPGEVNKLSKHQASALINILK